MLGAVVAVLDNSLIVLLLLARLTGRQTLEHSLGLLLICTILPLTYLIIRAPSHDRSAVYYVWIGLMILYLAAELFLDYILKYDFRSSRALSILYVMLFCGSTGGMIGLASLAGRGWTAAAAITFLIMVGLAFYQRAKTGM
jgi:hypothetical protein